MKEYNPKPDLWSKIQQRKDFDLQVKEHSQNLPERMPKADLWSAVESELDRKKPVIPLWKYGMVAASIAIILAISGVAYLQIGEKGKEPQGITEVSIPINEVEQAENIVGYESELEMENTEVIKSEIVETRASQVKSHPREVTTPIEIPELNLADLSIANTFVSKLIIPPAPEVETAKTLHQVSISWSKIKPKMQITTGFGRQESELNQKQQASSDQKAQVTLEINN